ncbi:MAG TPA: hypothetical protein VLV83_20915, partial [Acidobacteriota bacterium]|nr:hypothetical protein [Acidobacteriota bacterium]
MNAIKGQRAFFVSILVATLAVWALAEDPGQQEKNRQITLFYSASVAGAFEPCGCSGNPAGGLARRAALVNGYREEHSHPILQVDAGNYFAPLGPGSSLINELMADSLKEFPIAVLNLGSEDLHYWDQLSARQDLPTQIISTNLKPRKASHPAPRRYALVEFEGQRLGLEQNLRIGFLGITDPSRVKPNSGFRAS